MRIGIVMGGPSREREVSFAGGRTVYDNLDRRLFTPVPLFVDSRGRLVHLDWPYLYKGTLRDFYPPAHALPPGPFAPYSEQLEGLSDADFDGLLAELGTPIPIGTLAKHIDMAFLTLHGAFGEDGAIQGVLQWLGIPYTGAGLFGSALGIDKRLQRALLPQLGFASPKSLTLTWEDFQRAPEAAVNRIQREIGLPCVVKHPTQGSSIGVQIAESATALMAALPAVAFRITLTPAQWQALGPEGQTQWLAQRCDPREGLSLPITTATGQRITSPQALGAYLDAATGPVHLASHDAPQELLIEQFIAGTEFSCIVLETPEGMPVGLPPTEIIKPRALFDYRAKYLPGQARKRTPIHLPDDAVAALCSEAERLFRALHFSVYARLDGIRAADGTVYFNDPNTTSGMLPGSFFFHQAAEVGLTPTELLTYILLRSLQVRAAEGVYGGAAHGLHQTLLGQLQRERAAADTRARVGVFLGGYSAERHVALESGRNVYEKLAASADYRPLPLFVLQNALLPPAYRAAHGLSADFSLWELPTALLLKDNADDIAHTLVAGIVGTQAQYPTRPVVASIRARAQPITGLFGTEPRYSPQLVPFEALPQRIDLALNTVHGRPGEDGQLQTVFEALGLPYNGSRPEALRRTQDKAETNAYLEIHGVRVPRRAIVARQDPAGLTLAGTGLAYPVIAKPIDEGCSSAVKKLRSDTELAAYARIAFREVADWATPEATLLRLQPGEDFPQKDQFLLEELIATSPEASVIEVTVGFVTHRGADGALRYEVFVPSETRAVGEVLSLEEKFLAGEGQNLTPARLSPDPARQALLIAHVQAEVAYSAALLGLEGYSRFDGFVRQWTDGRYEFIFLEANTLPALTPATVLFHQAAVAGYTPLGLLAHLLAQAQAPRSA